MNRRTFLLTSFSAAVAGYFGLLKEAFAVEKQRYRPNVYEAWNFTNNTTQPIGYLTSLKIGSVAASNIIDIIDPEKSSSEGKWNTADPKPVGIISAIRWEGGVADPITFTCQITIENFKTLVPLIYTKDLNAAVEFAFIIYGNNGTDYYKAFHTGDQVLKGTIEKNNGELEFEIEEEVSREVPSPRNWELYLSIMPPESGEQTLYIGTSKDNQQTAKWGA